jgi:hypothetical protein
MSVLLSKTASSPSPINYSNIFFIFFCIYVLQSFIVFRRFLLKIDIRGFELGTPACKREEKGDQEETGVRE